MKPRKAILRLDEKRPRIIIKFHDARERSRALSMSNEQAQKFCDDVNYKILSGTFRIDDIFPKTNGGTIITQLCSAYLDRQARRVKMKQYSKASYQKDFESIKLILKHFPQDQKISYLTLADFNKLALHLYTEAKTQHGRTYKASSINGYYKHISVMFSWAVKNNYMDRNPLEGFEEIRESPKPLRILTRGERSQFRTLLATRPAWQLICFNLSIWTAARGGELLNLNKDSMTYEYVQDIGETAPFLTLHGKGDKMRKIPLLDEPVQIIQQLRERLMDRGQLESYIAKTPNKKSIPIYIERFEKGFLLWEIIQRNSISQMFRKARIELKIEDATFHDTRRTFATEALTQGKSLEWVQAVLGHADIKTTKIYTGVTDAKLLGELRGLTAG